MSLLTSERKVSIVFNYYDADISGHLDLPEIKQALQDTYGYVSDQMISSMLGNVDKDKNGKISRSELKEYATDD